MTRLISTSFGLDEMAMSCTKLSSQFQHPTNKRCMDKGTVRSNSMVATDCNHGNETNAVIGRYMGAMSRTKKHVNGIVAFQFSLQLFDMRS